MDCDVGSILWWTCVFFLAYCFVGPFLSILSRQGNPFAHETNVTNEVPSCFGATGGSCSMFNCFGWRGNTSCVDGACVCSPGFCSSESGVCIPLDAWMQNRVGSNFALRNGNSGGYLQTSTSHSSDMEQWFSGAPASSTSWILGEDSSAHLSLNRLPGPEMTFVLSWNDNSTKNLVLADHWDSRPGWHGTGVKETDDSHCPTTDSVVAKTAAGSDFSMYGLHIEDIEGDQSGVTIAYTRPTAEVSWTWVGMYDCQDSKDTAELFLCWNGDGLAWYPDDIGNGQCEWQPDPPWPSLSEPYHDFELSLPNGTTSCKERQWLGPDGLVSKWPMGGAVVAMFACLTCMLGFAKATCAHSAALCCSAGNIHQRVCCGCIPGGATKPCCEQQHIWTACEELPVAGCVALSTFVCLLFVVMATVFAAIAQLAAMPWAEKNHIEHMDRSILVCVADVGFTTYSMPFFGGKILWSVKGLFSKTAVSEKKENELVPLRLPDPQIQQLLMQVVDCLTDISALVIAFATASWWWSTLWMVSVVASVTQVWLMYAWTVSGESGPLNRNPLGIFEHTLQIALSAYNFYVTPPHNEYLIYSFLTAVVALLLQVKRDRAARTTPARATQNHLTASLLEPPGHMSMPEQA